MALNKLKYKYATLISFLVFLTCLTLFVFSLRANYREMTKLRDAVYSADKNNVDVSTSLYRLRDYVTRHMNTDLSTKNGVYPPLQLHYTYDRLLQSKIASTKSNNSQIYADAEKYCQTQAPQSVSLDSNVSCLENYINTKILNKISVDPTLYEFNFVSPSWSPDLAGFSEIIAVLSGIITLIFILQYLRAKKNTS